MDSASLAARADRRVEATVLMLVVFVALAAIAVVYTGWTEARDALIRVGLQGALILLGLALLHYVIRALRWHMLAHALGTGTSVAQNMRHFFGGFALTATPGRVGELIRVRWLALESGLGFGGVLPVAFADRAIELASMLAVIVGALLLTNLGTGSVWWLVLAGAAIVAIACSPSALLKAVDLGWLATGRRWSRLFVKLRRMTRRLRPLMHPVVLIPVLGIGCLGWVFEGVAFWLLLDWLGASIPVTTATAIFLCAVLSGALLGLPGGLGGVEASAILLLLLQGVPAETAVVATLVIRITTLWFAVLIGFAVFPFAEYHAARAREGRT